MLYEGTIESLNHLPYTIHIDNQSWIKEEDIIRCLCDENDVFYMKYFMGETYLNEKNHNGSFPLLHVLIAAYGVYEFIADMSEKGVDEKNYEKKVYPFVLQLAKIGAKEIGGEKVPLQVMEEMLLNQTN